MKNEGLLQNFIPYCVDNRLNKIPKYVKIVPTMIVSNINKPLLPKEAFEWVQSQKFLRNKKNGKNNSNNLIKKNVPKRNGPIPFRDNEMLGLSDNYAYKDIDKAFNQSYFGIDEKNIIFTAEKSTSINNSEQKNLTDKMNRIRKEQDKQYIDFMEQQQLNALISAENSKDRYQSTYNSSRKYN